MIKLNNESQTKFWSWVADDLELLARLHAFELTPETFDFLIQGQFEESLIIRKNSDRSLTPVMQGALKKIKDGDVSFDDLAADFAAIYLNVAYQASPNESAWLDDDHLERQEPMFQVRNWYNKYNLQTTDWRVRQDDNLSLQLLFIAHLLRLSKVPVQDLNHFMDFHILRWIEDFAQKIFERADTAFYACLAMLTAEYIVELREILAELEGKPRPSKEEIAAATAKETPQETFDPRFYSSIEGSW